MAARPGAIMGMSLAALESHATNRLAVGLFPRSLLHRQQRQPEPGRGRRVRRERLRRGRDRRGWDRRSWRERLRRRRDRGRRDRRLRRGRDRRLRRGAAPAGVGGCPRCVGTGGASATGGQVGTGGQSATGGNAGTDGGATGGHGAGGNGTGGGGGQGGAKSCDALATDYGNAITAAKECTLGASGQCQQLVNGSLSCPGCKQYVNDATTLSAIQTAWDAQNCSSVPHLCPAIACIIPTTSVCISSPTAGGPGGGTDSPGTCSPGPVTPTN